MSYLEGSEGKRSFDLIVKDLSINKLLPVLILNSDGEVAFDRFNGFYYTQISEDGGSRGARVFRHQLGTLHQDDVIIYEEKNPDFSVSGTIYSSINFFLVENTLSGDYIMITIRSLFKPTTNEVWMKHAGKEQSLEKFWLV